MVHRVAKALVAALPLLLLGTGCQVKINPGPANPAAPGPAGDGGEGDNDPAVAAVKKLGGQVVRDAARPGKPVVEVSLHHTKTTDADLAALAPFAEVRKLKLSSTGVTGAGL